MGIAADSSGNLYIADISERIQKFSSDGIFTTQWGEGYGSIEFDNPYAVFVDSEDNIFVSDTDENRIVKLTDQGEYITQWDGTLNGGPELSSPRGICVDSNGYVYVADYDLHQVLKYQKQ